MAQIDRIVDVRIDRQTAQIDVAGFGVPLLLSKEATFTSGRVKVFTGMDSVKEGDFPKDSNSYKMLQAMFSQKLKFPMVVVGKVEELESYTQALVEVENINDEWYVVVIDSKLESDIETMAAAIETRYKMFGATVESANAIDAGVVDDLGSKLKDKGYDRTFLMYTSQADEHPIAAWLWTMLYDAGSETWAYKALTGVTVNRLTDTAINALESKNINYYIRIKGIATTRTGVTCGGEWIDVIRFLDWWRARVQEEVFYTMTTRPKLGFTAEGAAIIESKIRSVVNRGVVVGGIATAPQPIVIAPNVLDVSEMIRGKRELGDFQVQFRLAGAIHSVKIRSTVTY